MDHHDHQPAAAEPAGPLPEAASTAPAAAHGRAVRTVGLDLPMAVGAIAMSVSTIVVAANAQLLRRLQLRRDPPAARPLPATA
jgi:hypothetical protein